jgi:hypothetical protein
LIELLKTLKDRSLQPNLAPVPASMKWKNPTAGYFWDNSIAPKLPPQTQEIAFGLFMSALFNELLAELGKYT